MSTGPDGTEHRAENFRLVAYPTARGCAAAYYPEDNVVVPLDIVTRAGTHRDGAPVTHGA